MHGTDSPGARGTHKEGRDDRDNGGRKKNGGSVDDLASATGHPPFKTVVELAQNRASGMVINDLPVNLPGLGASAACVVGRSVHLPHVERRLAGKYLERVHTNIAGTVPVVLARGRGYVYVVVGDSTCAICEAGAFSNVRSQ